MSWAFKLLSQILDQSGRDRAGDQDLPVLSITMKSGLVDQADKFKKRVASSDTSNYRIAYKNELVVGFPIDEGVLGFQTKYPAGIVSPAYDIWKLKDETSCHIPYLERYLRSAQARSLYASRMQGAVARRRSLTKTDFLNFEIPFPLFDDQVRIAHLLSKIEGLIARRKQHLKQLDDLLKSVFLVMFGDPVRNEKGWETGSLSSYGSFKNGLNFGKGESGATVRYLGVGDFKSKAKLDDVGCLAFIELNEMPAAEYFLQDGDLLFVRSNGNRELVGRCMAVYPGAENVTYSGFCIRYRINDPALQATYIAHLFRSSPFRRVLFQGGQGANIQNINQQILSGLSIPIPAEELQSRFAAIAERTESLKSRYQRSLTDLEGLYGALSQLAFKGELDLSRIDIPQFRPAEAETEETLAGAAAPMTLPIRLPELPAAYTLSGHGRQAALQYWFQAALEAMPRGGTLQIEKLIDAINFRLIAMDDQDLEFTSADYEILKPWIFQALATGKLAQVFDDMGNCIQLKAAQV